MALLISFWQSSLARSLSSGAYTTKTMGIMYRQEAWKPEKKSNFVAEIISFTAKYYSSNAGPEVGTTGLKSVCLLLGDER
jgi:hypothetical protein